MQSRRTYETEKNTGICLDNVATITSYFLNICQPLVDLLGGINNVAKVAIKLDGNKLNISSPEYKLEGSDVVTMKVVIFLFFSASKLLLHTVIKLYIFCFNN